MTIEQTVTIPADHLVSFEFLVPEEIPVGPALIEVKVTSVVERQDNPVPESRKELATPLTDALSGILSGIGDISLEEIRAERLAKYLK